MPQHPVMFIYPNAIFRIFDDIHSISVCSIAFIAFFVEEVSNRKVSPAWSVVPMHLAKLAFFGREWWKFGLRGGS